MSDIGEKNARDEASPQIPLLQRTHWIATAFAAMITSAVALISLISWVDPRYFQGFLVVLSIGILIYITSTIPSDNKKVIIDWFKAIQFLTANRQIIEPLVYKNIKGRMEYDSDVMKLRYLNMLTDSIIDNRSFARAIYRHALMQNKQNLATDILVDIDNYTEWLEQIDAVFKTLNVGKG